MPAVAPGVPAVAPGVPPLVPGVPALAPAVPALAPPGAAPTEVTGALLGLDAGDAAAVPTGKATGDAVVLTVPLGAAGGAAAVAVALVAGGAGVAVAGTAVGGTRVGVAVGATGVAVGVALATVLGALVAADTGVAVAPAATALPGQAAVDRPARVAAANTDSSRARITRACPGRAVGTSGSLSASRQSPRIGRSLQPKSPPDSWPGAIATG
ncbi:MAG: hypothetical protein LC797_02830 [Chloroflexi bacterium]|nr:hypothetical protein [Chloroflexota bacterium]